MIWGTVWPVFHADLAQFSKDMTENVNFLRERAAMVAAVLDTKWPL